jgi:hypothetical protein
MILIRLVACIEAFLIEAIRNVFAVDKKPFKIRSRKHEFTQDQLLNLGSLRELESLIIEKECRKLSSGGYSAISDFFSKKLSVPLDKISAGSIRIEFYFDTRNVLIHRLGSIDRQYRQKYHIKQKFVNVDQALIDEALLNAKLFGLSLHKALGTKYFMKEETKKGAKR